MEKSDQSFLKFLKLKGRIEVDSVSAEVHRAAMRLRYDGKIKVVERQIEKRHGRESVEFFEPT